jgi:hypothetical protein
VDGQPTLDVLGSCRQHEAGFVVLGDSGTGFANVVMLIAGVGFVGVLGSLLLVDLTEMVDMSHSPVLRNQNMLA